MPTGSRFPRPASIARWCGLPISRTGPATRRRSSSRRRSRDASGFADGSKGSRTERSLLETDLGEEGLKVIGLGIGLVATARLVLTDELIREALSRAKKKGKAGLGDGAEADPDELDADDVEDH